MCTKPRVRTPVSQYCFSSDAFISVSNVSRVGWAFVLNPCGWSMTSMVPFLRVSPSQFRSNSAFCFPLAASLVPLFGGAYESTNCVVSSRLSLELPHYSFPRRTPRQERPPSSDEERAIPQRTTARDCAIDHLRSHIKYRCFVHAFWSRRNPVQLQPCRSAGVRKSASPW